MSARSIPYLRPACPGRKAERGFTLVEVLIALTLLSLLMLALTGAMRAMGQTSERVEQRIEAEDDYRIAQAFLRDILGQASARVSDQSAAGGGLRDVFFAGQPDALVWIGIMPARHGLGGRHYMRLALESSAGGSHLVLRYAPWNGAPAFADWPAAEARVLVRDVQGLHLRYQHPLSGAWQPNWSPAADLPPGINLFLPSAIELAVDGPTPAWPPVVVALRSSFITDSTARMGSTGR